MKTWRVIAAHARVGLIGLGAALALGLTLALGAQQWQARAQRERSSAAQELAAVQLRARQRQDDLDYIQRQSPHYWRLVQAGFIGAPEREVWIEQLQAAAARAGLASALHYTLNAAKPLAQAASAAAGHRAEYHDLELDLSAVHEEDLLALLRELERAPRGRFRVNACQLSDPSPAGLAAQCVLRFFALEPTFPLAAPLGAAAPVPPALVWPGLDTLFYAPAERSAMARERSGDAGQQGRRPARLQGIVQRERGRSSAWINAQRVAEGQALVAGTPTRMAADGVVLGGKRLRVGETLDLESGVRTDLVAPGSVSKRAAK